MYLSISGCAQDTVSTENNSQKKHSRTLPTENLMLERDPINKTITYLKNQQRLPQLAPSGKSFEQQCLDFISTYHEDFLIENPEEEFSVTITENDNLGFTHVTLEQSYKDLPVWKGLIKMHFNRDNALYQIQGQYFPTPRGLDIQSGLDEKEVLAKAEANDIGISSTDYTAVKIVFFKDNVVPTLAYEIRPKNNNVINDNKYILAANNGEILNKQSLIQTIKFSE